jgi:hypothetical protein
MDNYIIVIPTYKRYNLISKNGSLNFLKKNNIPMNNIILFVANKEEKDLYNKYVPKNLYSGKIIIGIKGILNQRNFIINYFPKDQYIISIDDDIKDIMIKNNNKLRSIKKKELHLLFKNSYHVMKESKANIWGINMVTNPFMMQNKISTNLGIIPAGFYGWINNPKMVNKIKNDSREDVERSVMFFDKDNIIIRYMNITFKTVMKKTEGGIQALMSQQKRLKMEDSYTKDLKKKYPNYCCQEKNNGIRISLFRKKSKKKIKNINVLKKISVKNLKKNIQNI